MLKSREKAIVGSGGGGKGGGKGGSPKVADDDLQSLSIARLVDVISEGEIVGLVDGEKSIFFDDTPLQAANGSYNYEGVVHRFRHGAPDQDHIPGFSNVENEVPIDAEMTFGSPVIATIVNPAVDAVRVKINIAQLMRISSKGDVKKYSVRFAIDIRSAGGNFVTAIEDEVYGKTSSGFDKAYRIDLPAGGAPWDIQARRISQDDKNDRYNSRTFFAGYTEIIEAKFSYPDTALIGLEINAEQFGNRMPTRSYDVKGLKIRVPNNYDPETRSYSGVWDGNFKIAWTDNPAWVLYDLLTHERYGLGERIRAAQIDKWQLYTIGQYCDQLVPSGYKDVNGDDIMEPRFTFNGAITRRDEAYRVIQTVAAAFRGMSYWGAGAVTATADMPADPVKLVTPANVIDGVFNYSGSGLKARHTAVIVMWNDPEDGGRSTPELVEADARDIQRYGWRDTTVALVGCNSRGQARRFGKWLLDSERNETETVTYRAAWDHADVRPGDLIQVADPAYAGARMGGRLKSVSATEAEVDAPVTLAEGETYTVWMTQPDGKLLTRQLTNEAGEHTTLRWTGNIAAGNRPEAGAMWVVSGSDVLPRLFRVLAVSEVETGIFEISALFHDPTKFERVEHGIHFDPLPYQRFPVEVEPPENLRAVVSSVLFNGRYRNRITVSWSPSPNPTVNSYRALVRAPGSNWQLFTETQAFSFDIDNALAGDYAIRVQCLTAEGRVSQPATVAVSVDGRRTPPPAPSDLSAQGAFGLIRLDWINPPDETLNIEIWENEIDDLSGATRVATTSGTSFSRTGLPGLATRYYWIRAVDRAGNVSDWNQQAGTAAMTELLDGDNLEESMRELLDDLDLHAVVPVYEMPGPGSLLRVDGKVILYVPEKRMYRWNEAEQEWQPLVADIEEGQVKAIHIAANTIGQTHFADGLTPVGVVNGLPDPSEWDGPQIVTNEQDGKLYQIIEGEWQPVIADLELEDEMIENRHILDGAIDELKLAANAVTAAKIATGAVLEEKLANDAITAEKIRANAVSTEHLQDELITAEKLVANAVTSVKIATAAIDSTKLAENAVTTAKVAANAINAGKIASNAVQVRQIQANAVTTAKLADEAVQAAKIAANAVTEEKLAEAAVTASKIAEGAIEASKFAAGISAPQIVSALPTSGNFEGRIVYLTTEGKLYRYHSGAWTSAVPTADLSGLIQTAQLVDEAITAVKIATDAIDSTKIKDSAITAAKVAANAIEAGKIAANAVNSDQIAANAVTTAKLVNNAVNAAKIAANAVTQAKIANNAITARQIANGVIGAAKFASDIAAPQIVSSLPTSGNYEGRLVVYQGELHRYHSGSWMTAVAAVDITGQLTNDQIAGIEAAKLTGQITEVQIEDDAISAPKLAAGSVVSNKVAANAIVAAKIASNAVQARQIQANAVIAAKIASNAIEARHIVANSITAGAIAAGAVGADQIAANAISADKIIGNSITASKLVVTDTTNLIPDAHMMDEDSWTSNNWGVFSFEAPSQDLGSQRVIRYTPSGGSGWAGKFSSRPAPVRPGKLYLSQLGFAAVTTGSVRVRLSLDWYDHDGLPMPPQGPPLEIAEPIVPAGISMSDSVEIEAVPGASYVSAWVEVHSSTTAQLDFGGLLIRPMADAELIVDGAIIAEKIAANAISTNHLSAGSVTASQIAANAVTASQIAANAVKAVNIEANAVTTAKIAANAVTANEIAANAVKAAQIEAGAITTNKIAANAVTTGKIDTGAVTADTIATDAVIAAKIQANAVTAAKIASNAVQARQIQANAINANHLAANSVTASQIAADSVTAGAISAGAVGADQIAANAVTAGHIAADSISARQLVISDYTNLVEEPGFERGGIGWSLGSQSSIVPAGSSQPGEYVLRITGGGASVNNNNRIKVRPGDRLLLVVDAGRTSTTDGTVTVRVRFQDPNNNAAGGAPGITLSPSDAGGFWRRTRAIEVPSEADNCRVDILNSVVESRWDIAFVGLFRMASGELIVDGAITAEKITANAINGNHIATNSITADHLSANSVTASQIATNAVRAVNIEANAVTTVKIAANAVTANEIAANAIIAAKIEAGAVTTAKIATGAVTANEIASSAITTQKLAANAVTAAKIAANTITAAEIAANTITAAKIAANTITAAKIAANTITGNEIAANTIAGGKLIANTISTREIAASAVKAAQIDAGAVTAGKIAAGAVNASNILTNNIVVTDKINANAITAAKIASNAVQARQIQANAVNADKIAANSILTGHISAGAVNTSQLATNAITSDKIAANAITAKHIAIGDFENICKNPQFQGGNADGWDSWPSQWNIVARNPNSGTSAIRNAPTAYVARATSPESGSINAYIVRDLPVKPGERIYVSFDAASSGTSPTTVFRVRRYYRDAEGAEAGYGNTDFTRSSSSYTTYETSFTSTNSSVATVEISIRTLSSGTSTGYFTNVRVYKMTPSTLIEDGAITTEKVAANAITANKLAVNSVTAGAVAAGAIAASAIQANAVVAGKIASNAIQTRHISANSINASHITANSISTTEISANTIRANNIFGSAVNDTYSTSISGNTYFSANDNDKRTRFHTIGSYTTTSEGQGRIYFWLSSGYAPEGVVAYAQKGSLGGSSAKIWLRAKYGSSSVTLASDTDSSDSTARAEIHGTYGYLSPGKNTTVTFELESETEGAGGQHTHHQNSVRLMILECKR